MKIFIKKIYNKSIFKLFNVIFYFYDFINRILTLGLDFFLRKKVSNFLFYSSSTNLLDLACGTSDSIYCFFNSFSSFKNIIGIDLSKNMIFISKIKFYKLLNFYNVYFKIFNFLKLKKTNILFFSNITIMFGIRNILNITKSLLCFRSILIKKGRILILEFSLPSILIFRFFFIFYIRVVMPFFFSFFSYFSYLYLSRSIESFCNENKFLFLYKKVNFSNCFLKKFAFGSINFYLGVKF